MTEEIKQLRLPRLDEKKPYEEDRAERDEYYQNSRNLLEEKIIPLFSEMDYKTAMNILGRLENYLKDVATIPKP